MVGGLLSTPADRATTEGAVANPAPLISCVVPLFNAERYIREALNSILAQTYRPIEIVVVDDGSTDRSAQIVVSYGDRVRYLFQHNAGPAAARNRGLSAAHGEFIAFLDADDLWHPDKLSKQMARFRTRPELELCITLVQNFWIPELAEEQERYREHRSLQVQAGYICQALLARRQLFSTVGAFQESILIGEDTDWFARARDRGSVIELVPEVLVKRRFHHSNLTRRSPAQSREAVLSVTKAALDRRRAAERRG
jgi:glycosyltransferase involved in cell wall biosynthesis